MIKDDGCNIIGSVQDVIEYLKKEAINQLNCLKLFDDNFECDDVENIQHNVNNMLEVINGIYQDLLTDNVTRETIIKVNYDNSFAELFYIISEDEDNV